MTQLVSTLTMRGVKHALSEPTLSLENVTVAYAPGSSNVTSQTSTQYALQNVSCRIERGERIAVVGPNGAGKSTLFKLIVGTLKPQQGNIRIYGHQPGGHICIAYVPQRSQIDWAFPVTVEDVVMMGRIGQIGLFRRPKKQDWSYVRECLQRVGAVDLAKKQIGELSGGQQQRIFIARALAQEAELLLMDEPLTGLDVPSQEAIFEVLDNLRPDGVTVLVATHDLTLAAERFDRVMLLNKRVVSFGEATAVLRADNLVQAYGGHLHRVSNQADAILLTEGCCGEHEHGIEKGGD